MSKSANSRRSPSLSSASTPLLKDTPSFDSSQDDQNSSTRENSFDEAIPVDVTTSNFVEETSEQKEDNFVVEITEVTCEKLKEIDVEENCLIEETHSEESHPEETAEVLSTSVTEDAGLSIVDFQSKRISDFEIDADGGKIPELSLDTKENLSEEKTLESFENNTVESQLDRNDKEDSFAKKYKFTKISQIRFAVNFEEPESSLTTLECDNNLAPGKVSSDVEDNEDISSEEQEEITPGSSKDVGFKNGVCNTMCDSNLLHEGVYFLLRFLRTLLEGFLC